MQSVTYQHIFQDILKRISFFTMGEFQENVLCNIVMSLKSYCSTPCVVSWMCGNVKGISHRRTKITYHTLIYTDES